MKPTLTKPLGIDNFGNEYHLYSDNYVYQFSGPTCKGWFCSYPSWVRALYKITV